MTKRGAPDQPSRRALTRAAKGLVAGVGGAIGLFHVALLFERLRDQTIADPRVAGSWLLAAALGALALELRRHRYPLLSGRTGLAFWLLVLLLHLGVTPAAPLTLRAEQVLALPLELAAAVFAALAALALVGRHSAPLAVRRQFAPVLHLAPRSSLALGSLAGRFVPRPPPAG